MRKYFLEVLYITIEVLADKRVLVCVFQGDQRRISTAARLRRPPSRADCLLSGHAAAVAAFKEKDTLQTRRTVGA